MDVELARHQWGDGRRALERARGDRARYAQLLREVDVVTGELNRRVGRVFTLEQLAAVYETTERWVLDAIHEAFPDGFSSQTATAADAAFDAYARRASDYAP